MYNEIVKNEKIHALISNADRCLETIGFTKHDYTHMRYVVQRIEYILTQLEFDNHTIDLAKIAGYTHDVGNCINRKDHDISGAQIMFPILLNLGMPVCDVTSIVNAIGCHDSLRGIESCSHIGAALIIADKSDVRRSRVRVKDLNLMDIHNRVNYSIYETSLCVTDGVIKLIVKIDPKFCSEIDFYSIFMDRMIMCQTAANVLGCKFELKVIS